jgi:hypothetical protein
MSRVRRGSGSPLGRSPPPAPRSAECTLVFILQRQPKSNEPKRGMKSAVSSPLPGFCRNSLARSSAFILRLSDIQQRTTVAESSWGNIRFSVVYSVRRHEVVIVAVAHHKRRPAYWASRTSAV